MHRLPLTHARSFCQRLQKSYMYIHICAHVHINVYMYTHVYVYIYPSARHNASLSTHTSTVFVPAFAKFHRPHRASLHTGRRIVIRVLTSAMRNVSVITPIIWVPIFRDFKGLGPLAGMGLLQGPPYTANDATPSHLESFMAHITHTHVLHHTT